MPTPRRILIAPDKFKGTLTARQACEAMADGVRTAALAVGTPIELDLCPIADGGEGTTDILTSASNGTICHVPSEGPRGEPIQVPVGLLPDDSACFDSAAACGLVLVPPERRNPAQTSTRGVGHAIGELLKQGHRHILIGLGGSATIDAGVGMAAALGWRFSTSTGEPIRRPTGADLPRIARVESPNHQDQSLFGSIQIHAICDVRTELARAASLFGTQKGASPSQIDALELGLAHIQTVLGDSGLESLPGDGAAGGLGFGIRVFLAGRLVPGAAEVFRRVGLAHRAASADVVLTGEGRFDRGSLEGKAVGELLALCARGPEVLVLAGSLGDSREDLIGLIRNAGLGVAQFHAIDPSARSSPPSDALRELAQRSAASWLASNR